MQVPIEAAYAEACQALGEEIVKGRLLSKAVSQYEQKELETKNLEQLLEETGAVAEDLNPKALPPRLQEELTKHLETAGKGVHSNGNGRAAGDDQDHKQGGLSHDI